MHIQGWQWSRCEPLLGWEGLPCKGPSLVTVLNTELWARDSWTWEANPHFGISRRGSPLPTSEAQPSLTVRTLI